MTMNRIKELREELDITLEELSSATKIPKTSLSNYERGERNPKLEVWDKLASFFKVDTPYLIGLSPYRDRNLKRIVSDRLDIINQYFLDNDSIEATHVRNSILSIAGMIQGNTENKKLATKFDLDSIQKIEELMELIFLFFVPGSLPICYQNEELNDEWDVDFPKTFEEISSKQQRIIEILNSQVQKNSQFTNKK